MKDPAKALLHSMALIEKREPLVNAFARTTLEKAQVDLASLSPKDSNSPLFGRAFVAKDLIDTAGIPTEAGSKVLRGRVPMRNATVIDRLHEAGALLLGKAHTHEFAYGITTPASKNPIDLGRTPGGSSGGSAAAVAAGYCDLALGTDTIGSIRIPASFCGLVGLRSTLGRTPTRGIIPLSWTLDVVGPICRSVTDVGQMLTAIAGHDPEDLNSSTIPTSDYLAHLEDGVRGLVIGLPTNYFFENIDPIVEGAVRQAIELLRDNGAILREIEIPLVEMSGAVGFAISLPEASDAHHDWYQQHPDLYGADVLPYIELGFIRPAHEYIRSIRLREKISQSWKKATHDVDVVIAPTVPFIAPLRGKEMVELPNGPEHIVQGALKQNSPASILGIPALSVPCHTSEHPMPIGLQIMGKHFDEATVLRVGRAVEVIVNSPQLPLDRTLVR